MKNYSKMTDFEINRAVGDVSGVEWARLDSNYHPLSIWKDGELCVFCPCNAWTDAGQIIQSNGITVAFSDGCWFADASACWVDGVEWQIDGVIHENPLRAAMIVFLMMKDSK